MIRVGKTLLVIGCLSLASAACASEGSSEALKKALAKEAALLETVIADIQRDKPTYNVQTLPGNYGTFYTVDIEFPNGLLRTISVLQKATSSRIESATVSDVKRAPKEKDDEVSITRFDGAQAEAISYALGIKK